MSGHKPTPEQAAIIDAFATGSGLVIEAGAGAGKTSTLKMCAAATPRRRGLYLAYNRAIKDDAAKSFPTSVRAMTTHGLAFMPVASRYRAAGRQINGRRVPAREVAQILRINEPIQIRKDLAPLAPQQIARQAIATIGRFCKSGSDELERWHVPVLAGLEEPADRAELAKAILPYAQRAWADITATDGRLRFEHNHYLKIYQLSHPKLAGDFLLVDEAQDLNPCVAALVAEQDHMQVIYVGDSCQAINGWNGAVDAMRDAPGDRLYLRQSFRFGQPIADEANKWLSILDAKLRLRGFDQVPSRLEALGEPAAVLCRTNAEAVRRAAEAINLGRRAALVGGGDDIRSLAEAAIELRTKRSTAHPQLCAFTSWAEVQAYVQDAADGSDLKVGVALVDSYGPEAVLGILRSLVDEGMAEVVLSTAHKAKGREWATVRIADDFREPKPDPETGITPPIPREDAMLAYVAVTRARRVLDRSGLAWVDDWLSGSAPARAYDPASIMPDPPDELAEPIRQPSIRELIDASPLGTPEVRAAVERDRAEAAARLTGMPEEQADWDEGEPEPAALVVPACARCGGGDVCLCDPDVARVWSERLGLPAGPYAVRAEWAQARGMAGAGRRG